MAKMATKTGRGHPPKSHPKSCPYPTQIRDNRVLRQTGRELVRVIPVRQLQSRQTALFSLNLGHKYEEEKAKGEWDVSHTHGHPDKGNPQSDQLLIPLFRWEHKLPKSLRDLPLPIC
jgi:hypothetical protein